MPQPTNYITDAERLALLRSARAWGAAFAKYGDLVAKIEAKLAKVRLFEVLPCAEIRLRSEKPRRG